MSRSFDRTEGRLLARARAAVDGEGDVILFVLVQSFSRKTDGVSLACVLKLQGQGHLGVQGSLRGVQGLTLATLGWWLASSAIDFWQHDTSRFGFFCFVKKSC